MYSSYISGAVWRLTGVDTATPLDNATVRGATGTGTSLTFTSLNSATDGALLIVAGFIQSTDAGSTSLTQKSYIAYSVVGYSIMASAGASGDQTMNSGSSNAKVGQMFILKPASSVETFMPDKWFRPTEQPILEKNRIVGY
jgi:hypothetical protein